MIPKLLAKWTTGKTEYFLEQDDPTGTMLVVVAVDRAGKRREFRFPRELFEDYAADLVADEARARMRKVFR